MKRTLRIISFVLLLTIMLPHITSCSGKAGNGTDTGAQSPDTQHTDIPGSDPTTEEGKLDISEEGKVEFNVLGVRTLDSYPGIEPAEGNSVVCVYVEAVNKSTRDHYVKRNCLDTATSELLYIDEEHLPENYDNFGGYIASGKRRLFLLCFEEKTAWFRITLNYSSYDKNFWNKIMMGKDYRTEAEMLSESTQIVIR